MGPEILGFAPEIPYWSTNSFDGMLLRMSGIFISDLHLFSQRSVGLSRWRESFSQLERADQIILGGDIFDLRWSQVGTFQQTIDEAGRWIDTAIRAHSRASWVYLLGNHDCHPEFQGMLDSVKATHPQFNWFPMSYVQGNRLFLHGDILDAPQQGGVDHYRKRFHEIHPKGNLSNFLYSTAVGFRVHKVVANARHRPAMTCQSLLDDLRSQLPHDLDGIDSIYFGHTHVPILGKRNQGYTFYNPGSGIRHLKYHPIPF